jgi:hypothetical protein
MAFVPKLPPVGSFISLSHAVTWIAFGRSMDSRKLAWGLRFGADRGSAGKERDKRWDNSIESAVQRLADKVRGELVVMQGRFAEHFHVDEFDVEIEVITPLRVADFQCFDTLYNSLYRGRGLVWDRDHSRQILHYPRSDERHYRFVEVNRSNLLKEFPPTKPEFPQSTGGAEKRCEAWLSDAFRSDPEIRKAKADFMSEARSEIKGLGVNAFNRAWSSVATVDRKQAGAKSGRRIDSPI